MPHKKVLWVYLREAGGLSVSEPRGEQAGHEAAGVAAGNNVTGTGSSLLQEAQGLALKQPARFGEVDNKHVSFHP